MNNRNTILALISHDKGLLALLGGMVIIVVAMVSLVITAGIWYF